MKKKMSDQEVLSKIIPKNELEDGVVYLSLEGTERLCRCIKEARWNETHQVFWYSRTKFNYVFEDEIEHFADVVMKGSAGFTPIKRKK